jgi:hypothetical protein
MGIGRCDEFNDVLPGRTCSFCEEFIKERPELLQRRVDHGARRVQQPKGILLSLLGEAKIIA